MKIYASVLLLISFALILHAENTSDPVFDRLAKVERFAFGGTGLGGVISQGEKDFKEILSRSTALKDFERLYSSGNPQAQCYALVGIHTLDPKRFEELSKSLSNNKTEIMTMSGCLIIQLPFHTIVESIATGFYFSTPEKKKKTPNPALQPIATRSYATAVCG